MNTSDLIQQRHLSRRAKIYIRQSTPNQVLTNLESQRVSISGSGKHLYETWQQCGELGRTVAQAEWTKIDWSISSSQSRSAAGDSPASGRPACCERRLGRDSWLIRTARSKAGFGAARSSVLKDIEGLNLGFRA